MTIENLPGQTEEEPAQGLSRRVDPTGFPDLPRDGNRLPATLANVRHLLSECGVLLGYDTIKKRMHIAKGAMELEECDLLSLANLNGLGSGHFLDFVGTLARRTPLNPVKGWIDSKPWDGTDRLEALYATVEVLDDYPTFLRDRLLYRWLLSCVAAALSDQGFRTRGVLTFQGEQGIGKTSWIARLVPEPFRSEWVKLDHHLDASNKDSVLGAVTHWICEIGELDSSFRKDVARLKGFITNDCDKIRPPYARSAIDMPRRTAFSATVNEWRFLVDNTGNSRWFTIPAKRLHFNHDIDMQQVFAQLAVDFRAGEQWWLTSGEEAMLTDLNKQHEVESVIAERIKDRLGGPVEKFRTALQVLEEIGIRSPSNTQCKEAGAFLRSTFGPPKRVQGRDKWKIALTSEQAAWQSQDDDEDRY